MYTSCSCGENALKFKIVSVQMTVMIKCYAVDCREMPFIFCLHFVDYKD